MPEETYDPHKTETDVRQGNRRRMNLRVLLISGTLIVIVFGLLYLFGYPFGPLGT